MLQCDDVINRNKLSYGMTDLQLDKSEIVSDSLNTTYPQCNGKFQLSKFTNKSTLKLMLLRENIGEHISQ